MTDPTTKTLTLSGKRLDECRNLLTTLADRALPSGDAEGLVFSLLYLLKPATDEYDAQIKRIQKDGSALADEKDEAKKLAAIKTLNERLDALQEKVFEVRKPKTRLQAQHFPKEKKSADNNGAASVLIRFRLSPELAEPPVEDAPDGGEAQD